MRESDNFRPRVSISTAAGINTDLKPSFCASYRRAGMCAAALTAPDRLISPK